MTATARSLHRNLIIASLLCACPMDDDDDGGADEGTATTTGTTTTGATGSSEASDSTTAEATFAVTGSVRRTVELGEGGDGIGTLFVAAFGSCENHGEDLLGFTVVPNADLSSLAAEVPFAIQNLPGGAVYLASFLDDDGNADPLGPLPDGGDPVYGDDACDDVLSCITVELVDADVSRVTIELDLLELDPEQCP